VSSCLCPEAIELFQLSASKVTVSTVAPTPDAFKDFAKAPCVMAWSVHAANDELRKKLVPTSKYSMAELRQGFIDT
jgi:23S rRNA (adenine2503-C2)-methyltransferase